MTSKYPIFDTSKIQLCPLAKRKNDLERGFILPLEPVNPSLSFAPDIHKVAKKILHVHKEKLHTLLLLGGHVVRSGVQHYLIDMMRKGLIHGIAVNGAVAIHDYEIALQGATTESVARYIQEGQFGLWEETGRINDIVKQGIQEGLGFGEALGKELAEGAYPHANVSLFAAAWKYSVPITVHVGIGYDIIHAHPSFDGAATGAASYRDFLIFTKLLEKLACVCTFGSAVMAPEVFLKALSMVRNVQKREGLRIMPFTSLVCDLQNIPRDCQQEASKHDPRYFFRPWKTLLARTVAGGGESYYVQGEHAITIPTLWNYLNSLLQNSKF